MIPKFTRQVVVWALVPWLFGCWTWHTQASVTQGVIDHPDRLRIGIEGKDARIFEALRIEGDSLIGFEFQKGGASKRVVLPVSSVERVEHRELDRPRTFLLIAVYTMLNVVAVLNER